MSTLAGLSSTFSHRGRAPTRCTPNRGGRQILHHCSGGCGAAPLAQVAGFRSSRGPPCVGGAWPSISSVSPISPISPVIGAFAHLREVDLPRLGLSAEVVGGATAVHAAVNDGAGSRASVVVGGTARPNPLPVETFAGSPRRGRERGETTPSHPPPTRLWRVPSLSLSQGERGLGMALSHGHL